MGRIRYFDGEGRRAPKSPCPRACICRARIPPCCMHSMNVLSPLPPALCRAAHHSAPVARRPSLSVPR
eukprot:2156174-Prymnesium_polylepis.1